MNLARGRRGTLSFEEPNTHSTLGRSPDLASRHPKRAGVPSRAFPSRKAGRWLSLSGTSTKHHSGGTVRESHPLPYSPAALPSSRHPQSVQRTIQSAATLALDFRRVNWGLHGKTGITKFSPSRSRMTKTLLRRSSGMRPISRKNQGARIGSIDGAVESIALLGDEAGVADR